MLESQLWYFENVRLSKVRVSSCCGMISKSSSVITPRRPTLICRGMLTVFYCIVFRAATSVSSQLRKPRLKYLEEQAKSTLYTQAKTHQASQWSLTGRESVAPAQPSRGVKLTEA